MSDQTAIAIIGLSGRFPRAANLDAFWDNLRNGRECFTQFSDAELLEAGATEAEIRHPDYVRAKAVLEDADLFDAGFFGYNPREAELIDPQQRVFLECAHEALEHAGYGPGPGQPPQPAGVFAGTSASTYLLAILQRSKAPDEGAGNLQLMIGNDKDYLTTRVSYKLNLTGPSIAIQTACSTSLVAVHMAVQSLLGGECAMALAGGVCISLPQTSGYLYQEGGIASPDGRCRPFDADAKGTNGGSGAGVVVLKRLADAQADGDTIHAIIRGSAVNNDGAHKVGFTAPSQTGQARVIAEALAVAGVTADTIGYIEAHGTATPVGDPIEVAALTQAFRETTAASGFCALGSVKSNFGHLDAAAGIAGLIKTVLALKHREIPPSLHFTKPNPIIPFAQSPFFVAAKATPWTQGPSPRRAGVSSFGIGGTNAHVVLEEAPAVAAAPSDHPQLLVLSAKNSASLRTSVAQLADHLAAYPETSLADAAYTLQLGRGSWDFRHSVVARSVDEAIGRLRAPFEPRRAEAAEAGSTAVATLPNEGDLTARLTALGQAWEHGAPVDWNSLPRAAGRPRRIALPTYVFARQRCWAECLRVAAPPAPQARLDALYVPRWLPAPAAGGPLTLRRIVYLDAGTDLSTGILRELRTRGCEVTSVSRDQPDLAGLDLTHADAVVYAWTLRPLTTPEPDAAPLEWAFHRLMRLGQTLAEQPREAPLRLVVLADGLADIMPTDRIDPFQSCVLGAVREMPKEMPWLRGRCLDVRPDAEPKTVVDELLRESDESAVALRGGERFSRCLQAAASPELAAAPLPLRRHGVYWIVGGFGGVGLVVARFLARHYQARLILTSRAQAEALPAGVPFAALRQRLAALESGSALVPIAARGNLAEQLTAWSAALVFEYLQTSGLPLAARTAVALDELAKRLAIQPAFGKFFAFMVALLARTGIAANDSTHLTLLRVPASAAALRAQIEHDHPGFGGMLDFIRHCTGHYPQVLAGKLPGISVIYPDGSSEKMEQAVAATVEHSTVRIQLDLLVETVRALAPAGPGVPLRILEVGGGHGIVTDAVLPQLGEVEYWFTDISRSFVEKRRHRAEAAGEKRLVTATLDIARDPLGQGFQAGHFDLVLAMNVVHATASVGATLTHLRTLLKPGGHLALLETVRQEPWVDLVWGLAPGWWSFEDFRTASPLLSPARWRDAFEGAGYVECNAFPGEAGDSFGHDAALLLARAPVDRTAAAHRTRAIAGLESLGAEVLALSADVADHTAMQTAWLRARERFGPVHGAFHSALVLEDRLLATKSRAQAERVLRPKIDGTLVLDQVLADVPLDFLALFSSLAAFDPAPGQFDYAAASAFQDAYAHARRAAGRRVVSIDWNRWRDSGYVARLLAPPAGTAAGIPDRTVVLAAGRQWFLAEHRIGGTPVVPGTALLEQVVIALLGRGLRYPLCLEEVQFLAPCRVPEGEDRTLTVHLTPTPPGVAFTLATAEMHARGLASGAPAEPDVVHDLARWRAACGAQSRPETAPRPAALGARWQSVQWTARNAAGTQAMAEIVLPAGFAPDLDRHPLHPALLDVASGFAHAGDALPFGYRRVTIRGPLPARLLSLARVSVKNGNTTIDVAVTDADGREILRVEGYELRGQRPNRRLQQSNPGQLETLALHAAPREAPAPDEVEIEVVAAGLNFKDVLVATGLLPVGAGAGSGFGAECAGRVVRVGTAVAAHFRPGDEVLAAAPGALADFVLAKAAHVFPKPPELSFAAAATVPVAFATAWFALKTVGRIAAGQRVLIHAATGGVGLAAVQIARQAGAEIFATAGNEQKRAHLRALGVPHIMDSRSLRFVEEVRALTGGAGVDLVLNSLSGEALLGGLACVARGGLLLELGRRDLLGGGSLPFAAFSQGIGFVAIDLSPDLPAYRAVIEAILAELGTGKLHPLPSQLFRLEAAPEAFQLMLAARQIGKIVLAPEPDRTERPALAGGRRTGHDDAARNGLSDDEGLHLLQLALQLDAPQVVVSPDGNPLRAPAPPAAPPTTAKPAARHDGTADAPLGDVERTLVSIWRTALGVETVGLDDDFFDLLGDSLLAVDVLAKIRQQLNVALPASTLFTSPTIRALTALIKHASAPQPLVLPKAVVPLHRGGGRGRPLFLAPPILGTLFPYVPLAQILGKDRPVYGLSPRGNEPGETPFASIPELAAYFGDAIRAVQPHGPYMISGWSFGATLAFEVTRQLEAQGQVVALLAPIDLPAPSNSANGLMDFLRFFGGTMARNIFSYLRDYCYLKSRPANHRGGGFLKPLLERAVIAQVIPPEARESFAAQPNIREILRLYHANTVGLAAYLPPLTCKARIDLFRTADHSRRRHSEALGWEKSTLAQAVVHSLPGDHMTILRAPHVAALAAAMNLEIQRVA